MNANGHPCHAAPCPRFLYHELKACTTEKTFRSVGAQLVRGKRSHYVSSGSGPQPGPHASDTAHPELRNSCFWLVAPRGGCMFNFLRLFTLLSLTSSLLVQLGERKKKIKHFILIFFFSGVYFWVFCCLLAAFTAESDAFNFQLPLFFASTLTSFMPLWFSAYPFHPDSVPFPW